MTEKSSPSWHNFNSNGLSPFVFKLDLKSAYELRKISLGPANPSIARYIHFTAISVENAAAEPLESVN